MKSNPRNWENCTMFVQDIKSPGVNITAELTEEEVDSFKQICKMFIPFSLHDKNIDEYLSQMSKMPSPSKIDSALTMNVEPPKETFVSESSKPSVHSFQNLSDTIADIDQNSNIIPRNKLSTGNIGTPSSSTPSKMSTSLINLINIDEVSVSIKTTAIDFIFRTMERISHEFDIVGLLQRHLKAFDSKLEMMPFGSATYGFGGRSTDFNILVNTGTKRNANFIHFKSIQLD